MGPTLETPPRTDTATVVDAIAGRRGGSGTLTAGRDTVTWAEVHDRARRITTLLRGHGIGPGTRIGLLADTSVELVAALQAGWLAGAAITVLPQPARQSIDAYLRHLRRIIADARPALVLVGDPFTPLAIGARTADLTTFHARAMAVEPATPHAPDTADLAVLQYTSGSTGQPRGVPVTHGQLAANLAAIRVATQHDRVHGCHLSWLPLFHDLGLIGGLALPMSCGCGLVLQPPSAFATRPIEWFEAIATHRATTTAAPNFAWGLLSRLLASRPDADPAVHLGSLRMALTGAEPIDPSTVRRFTAEAARQGMDPSVITCAYGLAEATLAVTVSTPGTGFRVDIVDPVALEARGEAVPTTEGRSLAKLGRPVPGMRLRVVDRVGDRALTERRVGRIEVAGPSVIDGYWDDLPTRSGGWLRTGDLGYLADGELVVCGRESDLLFAAGRNVFPQDVETAVTTVPAVRAGNAVAFGVPRPGAGDWLVVAVESRAWADAGTVETVRAAVRTAVVTEVGLTPRAVAVLPPGGLSKTSSGKARRAEMRRRYLAGELDQPPGATDDTHR
jgi:fatty-acyl-CoA synthase